MVDSILGFFQGDFMPHGHCFYWRKDILFTHLTSDILIALSYFSLPIALTYFVKKRKDLSYRWAFIAFSIFILSCGITHVFGIYTLWVPVYAEEGIAKAVTALSSLVTAILVWPIIPKALRLPSPTALEEANQRLTSLNQQLEARVAERTAELKRSNAELENFAYIASHDLKSPLRTIISFSDILREDLADRLDASTQETLDFITGGSKKMSAMVADLLNFSRIERNIELEPISVENALAESLQQLDEEIKAKPVTEIICQSPLPAVKFNYAHLVRILVNLVGNSIKYGASRVIFKAKTKDDHTTISIEDNGIGIDAKYHDKIFQMFQRLHTEDEYPGSGMGLAICKKIVEAGNGEISLTSQPGKGSIFFLKLLASHEENSTR